MAVQAGRVRAATETSETPAFLRWVAKFKQKQGKEMESLLHLFVIELNGLNIGLFLKYCKR